MHKIDYQRETAYAEQFFDELQRGKIYRQAEEEY